MSGSRYLINLKLLVLFCFSFFAKPSFSQVNIEYIKTNPNYWWAEGHGITIEEANRDALSQIIQQISVSISVNSQNTLDYQETSGGENTNYKIEETVKESSFASLQNVKMMVLSPEPEAHVFRWVAKEEVSKMFELRKQKVLDFIEAGKVAEKRLQIDDALRNYYWALLLATSLQDPVYCEFGGKKSSCVSFLPQKIKSVISNITANVISCEEEDNRFYVKMNFKYNGNDVSSLQLRYFDGQSYMGPLVAKDGEGVLDMLVYPADKKFKLSYEYMFRDEASNLDPELQTMFNTGHLPTFKISGTEVFMTNTKGRKKNGRKEKQTSNAMVLKQCTNDSLISPEPIVKRERMELDVVENPNEYLEKLEEVENAIRSCNPESVYNLFTNEGYKMFRTLLKSTGRVSLVGKEQNYEFIRANGQILARFCKVKIKCSNGKTFMENIVFRFNENTKKIQSLAYALTKKAEDDIFNAEARWTNLSRFVILQFMEDYQTAYSLKRLDYIEQIFSDQAIIITGTMLKPAKNKQHIIDGQYIDLGGDKNVEYTRRTKKEYLAKLKQHFKEREYIHLTFEDNVSQVINAPRIPLGTAFAIEISQIYTSPLYSDKGYLTLVLDTSGEQPIIYVRLWQPDKTEMIQLDEFMSKFKF